jgi:hypothetical protein
MAIYVGVSPGDIPRNAPLLRRFFDALLNVNTSTTPEQDPSCVGAARYVDVGRLRRDYRHCKALLMVGRTAISIITAQEADIAMERFVWSRIS